MYAPRLLEPYADELVWYLSDEEGGMVGGTGRDWGAMRGPLATGAASLPTDGMPAAGRMCACTPDAWRTIGALRSDRMTSECSDPSSSSLRGIVCSTASRCISVSGAFWCSCWVPGVLMTRLVYPEFGSFWMSFACVVKCLSTHGWCAASSARMRQTGS
eukprot:gene15003-biopygen15082